MYSLVPRPHSQGERVWSLSSDVGLFPKIRTSNLDASWFTCVSHTRFSKSDSLFNFQPRTPPTNHLCRWWVESSWIFKAVCPCAYHACASLNLIRSLIFQTGSPRKRPDPFPCEWGLGARLLMHDTTIVSIIPHACVHVKMAQCNRLLHSIACNGIFRICITRSVWK